MTILTRILSVLGLLFVIGHSYCVAEDIDSLRSVIGNSFGDEKLNTQAKLAIQLSENNPDSAILLANEILKFARWNQPQLKGLCFLGIGESYFNNNELDKALNAYTISTTQFEKATDTMHLAQVANSMGLVYYYQAKFDSAMIVFQKSLKYEQLLNNSKGIAKSHQNIALIFYHLDDLEKFYEHNKIALAIYKELNDEKYIAEIANNMAVAYISEKNYDKAFLYYKMALTGFNKVGDELNKANVMNNLGSLFYYKKEYNTAIEYLSDAIKTFTLLNNLNGQVHAHSRLGDIYMQRDQLDYAIREYITCETINKRINVRDLKVRNLKSLAAAYKKLDDFENALRVTEESHAISDSIFTDEKLQTVLKIEKEYGDQNAQQELISLQAKSEVHNLLIVIIIIVACAIITIVVLWNRHQRLKENQRLVNLEQRVMRSQLSPHFLFNALSTIQFFVLENKTIEAIDYIGDFSKLIRLVLQSSQEEYITLETEKTIMENYLELLAKRYENKINYLIHFDDNIVLSKILIPPMLAQPFIENAIEHGELGKRQNGHIWVSFSIENNQLKYRIQDNGIGIEHMAEKKNGHQQKAVAISITKERLRLINEGEPENKIELVIEDLSKYGKNGTLIEFSIPVHQLN